MEQESTTPTVPAVETTPAVEQTSNSAVAETVAPAEVETIELEGKSLYSIAFAESGIPYKNGKRSKEGKKFTRYTRNNIAFAIPDEHPFNADFANGQVKSVILTKGTATVERVDDDGNKSNEVVNTLNFGSYINKQQWATIRSEELEDAKAAFAVASFKKLKSEPVSADLMTALLNASA